MEPEVAHLYGIVGLDEDVEGLPVCPLFLFKDLQVLQTKDGCLVDAVTPRRSNCPGMTFKSLWTTSLPGPH